MHKRGWHNENYRHSLAAKGIMTSRFYSKFYFDHPQTRFRKVIEPENPVEIRPFVEMNIDDDRYDSANVIKPLERPRYTEQNMRDVIQHLLRQEVVRPIDLYPIREINAEPFYEFSNVHLSAQRPLGMINVPIVLYDDQQGNVIQAVFNKESGDYEVYKNKMGMRVPPHVFLHELGHLHDTRGRSKEIEAKNDAEMFANLYADRMYIKNFIKKNPGASGEDLLIYVNNLVKDNPDSRINDFSREMALIREFIPQKQEVPYLVNPEQPFIEPFYAYNAPLGRPDRMEKYPLRKERINEFIDQRPLPFIIDVIEFEKDKRMKDLAQKIYVEKVNPFESKYLSKYDADLETPTEHELAELYREPETFPEPGWTERRDISTAMRTMFAAKMLGLKNYPQKTNFTCGPASLKMVMEHYGQKHSEKALAKAGGTTRSYGTGHNGMKKAANKFGFDLTVKKNADISDIKRYVKQKKPVIVDWFPEGGGHYSVVKGVDKNNLYMDDPAYSDYRKVKIKDFKESWFDYNGRRPKNGRFYTQNMLIVEPKKEIVN